MGKDAAEIRTAFHSRLGQIARDLTRELYPDGLPRGTQFSELEAVAGALGDEMARQLIAINVQEQADDWPEDELGECPVCGGAARKAPDEPRVLTTTRGDVTWKQRVAHCPRCRRAFFPSDSIAGDGPLPLQPTDAAKNRPCGRQQPFLSAGVPRSGRTG
jgi:hypothetical protein